MFRILRWVTITALLLIAELAGPLPVFALQAHGYIGLYVHQEAHIFFLLAMLIFAYRIYRSGLINRREWRWMSHGALLLALWNGWALTGHFIERFVPADHIQLLGDDLVPSLAIASWQDVVYFILKMDHLLSVPAILCFYLGIKTMLKEYETTSL